MPSPEATAPLAVTSRVGSTLPWVELSLLLLAAVGGLVFQLTLSSREARTEDYEAVAAVLQREAQPGDVVLLAPWWTERARLYVPEGLPVVGYLHSDGDDLLAHPRIWVLAEPRLPRAARFDFERAFLPGRSLEGGVREFGRLTLARYRNGRYRPVSFSAVDSLPRASVYLEGADGHREPCAWDGQRFRCPRGLHVGAEWHELFYEPRRCLWMQPPGGATRLVAEFREVPATGALLLEGGIIWEHATRKDVTPLEVGVDDGGGQVLAALSVPGGQEGMQRREVPLSGAAPGTVRLWTRSERPDAREACVELRALGRAEGRP